MGVGVSLQRSLKRVDKEQQLCPNDSHIFGHWGKWHKRYYRYSHNSHEIRFRVCKKCKRRELQSRTVKDLVF